MGSPRPWLYGALLLAACGGTTAPRGDQKIVTVQENSSPTGFVIGRVLDAADGKPVAGAVISTFSDGLISASSDVGGQYRLGPLPAGSYSVRYEGPGFLRRSFSLSVQSPNTMFPVGNTVVTQNVDLARGDATVEGLVLTNAGQIAKGVTLYVDLRESGFDVVASTKSEANGKFKLTGLPGAAYGQAVTVLVAPWDENGDGVSDYNSASRFYSLFPAASTYSTITLFGLGVQLITSNVSDGDLLPNEAITLAFSGGIRTNQSTITLFRNAGGVQVGSTVTWDTQGNSVTLMPVGGPLVEGQGYYVLYAIKAVNGATTNGTISFTARPPSGAPPLGTVANFRVTVPLAWDSGLTSVSLAWDALANAGGYRIYGKDTATASAYLLLSSISSGLSTSATVNLSFFDSVTGDSFTTPLGHRNAVRLTIVAVDRVGNETSFATAATLQLADAVAPTVFSAQQGFGSANNLSGGSAATVQYQIVFSELMATDTVPQLTLPNATTSAVWAWVSANRGTFAITIPPGIDGRGTLTLSGGKDTSGNAQAVAYDGPLQ